MLETIAVICRRQRDGFEPGWSFSLMLHANRLPKCASHSKEISAKCDWYYKVRVTT